MKPHLLMIEVHHDPGGWSAVHLWQGVGSLQSWGGDIIKLKLARTTLVISFRHQEVGTSSAQPSLSVIITCSVVRTRLRSGHSLRSEIFII